MKKLLLRKMLLAAVCLCVGANAWGQIVNWSANTTAGTAYNGGSEQSSNTSVVSIILGAAGENWASRYNSKTFAGVCCNNNENVVTLTDGVPTSGTFIKIIPVKDIKLTGSDYSFQICNHYMVCVDANNIVTQTSHARSAAATPDYGKLLAGNTYYLYFGSFKNSTDQYGFKSLTATSYENYTIHYLDENGTTIKDDVVYNNLFGTEVVASAEDMAQITYNNRTYAYKSGNEIITLGTETNEITLVYENVSAANYTIKYVDGDNNSIADDVVIESFEGAEVTASGENLPTYITYNNKKYEYASGNKILTVTNIGANNVITLVYNEALKYSYTVKNSLGTIITSGSNYKDETIYYFYPQVIKSGNTLYSTSTDNTGVDGSGYKSKFVLDSDNKEITKTYIAGNITNLLFLAEGEDIFSRGDGANADVRLSMGAGGYASSKTAIVTLPAGSYTLCGVNRGNGSGFSDHTFYKGDEVIFTTTPQGYNTGFSQDFTLTTTTTIYMQGGGNTRLLDYVYIYGTTDNEIVGEVDFSTDFMGAHKDMTISQGQTVKFTFKNHGNGDTNWYNWLVRLSGTTGVDHTLRADNYVIGDDESTVSTRSITEDGGAIIWSDILEDMKDASVEMTVTYTSAGMFSVIATSIGATHTYVHNFAYKEAKSGSIKLELGVENAWLEIISSEQNITGTIASSGYSSLASAYGLDFSSAIGLTAAYVITKTTTESVTLTSVGELPANSGVILKGEPGAAYSVPVKADAANVGTNLLSAAVNATPITANTAYILQSGKFHLVTADSEVPAGKAYLLASNVPSAARALNFSFVDDETTGISNIKEDGLFDGGFYNVQGQRIDKPAHGLYIVNGKKVIIK